MSKGKELGEKKNRNKEQGWKKKRAVWTEMVVPKDCRTKGGMGLPVSTTQLPPNHREAGVCLVGKQFLGTGDIYMRAILPWVKTLSQLFLENYKRLIGKRSPKSSA